MLTCYLRCKHLLTWKNNYNMTMICLYRIYIFDGRFKIGCILYHLQTMLWQKWLKFAPNEIRTAYIWDCLCYTVWCRYNKVNFLPNPRNRHPIACPWGQGMGVCCDSSIWFTFCHCYRSIVCNIVINCVITALDCMYKCLSNQWSDYVL